MKPLRIGWFYQDLNLGGGQRVCREISRILFQRGHFITVVVPRGRGSDEDLEGVKIVETGPLINAPTASIIACIPFMLKAMGRQDVIISSMPLMGILNWLHRASRLKYHWLQTDDMILFDDRTLLKSKFALSLYKASVKFSYKLPVKYWCNSQWTKERFQKYSAKSADIVTPGVNTGIFRPLPQVKRIPNLIAIMGRRVKMKGLADALTALNIIAEKDINFRVRIFTRESLILEKCNFPVEIVSPPDDEPLVKDLCECGLFLAASWFEGFYLPGLEAMACGLPVVTTDNGGCREYALDGKNCLMVPPRQPEKLAKAVIKILNNPGLAEKLSHRGLQTAQKFDWEKIVDVMESQFERDLATI